LCGCGLLGVGIWLSVSQGNFATFSPSFPSLSAANLVIALGAIIMVTGFLGCLGAIKENKCLLLSFFIVLLIILLAELILLILFFVYMDKIQMTSEMPEMMDVIHKLVQSDVPPGAILPMLPVHLEGLKDDWEKPASVPPVKAI
ncbi:UNVERIFIED_CONTAM: Tetraspanin-9, partial [Gekko kuhli]